MATQAPKRILVATDFSDGSNEAFEEAIEIARPTGAEIEVLHVIEPFEELSFDVTRFDADPGALYAMVDRLLSERAARVGAAGLRGTTKIVEGNAVVEIIKRGRDIGADLVVVGTHGQTGIAHAMLGSVAEKVVRRATCPVLTVPFSKKAA